MMDEISGKPRKSVIRLACHDWGIMDEISCKPPVKTPESQTAHPMLSGDLKDGLEP